MFSKNPNTGLSRRQGSDLPSLKISISYILVVHLSFLFTKRNVISPNLRSLLRMSELLAEIPAIMTDLAYTPRVPESMVDDLLLLVGLPRKESIHNTLILFARIIDN